VLGRTIVLTLLSLRYAYRLLKTLYAPRESAQQILYLGVYNDPAGKRPGGLEKGISSALRQQGVRLNEG